MSAVRPLFVFTSAALLWSIAPACSSKSSANPDQGNEDSATPGKKKLRIGQFNLREMSTDKLVDQKNPQIDAAATIVARFAPDIACFNEIEYDIKDVPTVGMPGSTIRKEGGIDDGAKNAERIRDRIQAKNPDISYVDTLITRSNSGFKWKGDMGNHPEWFAWRGWEEFVGRFNTVVLSRYPIKKDATHIEVNLAWDALPDNSIARMKTEKDIDLPAGYPLFEKSLNVIPLDVDGETIYLVMLHPTAPAFWDVNVYRNHDEIHALKLFLDGTLPGVEPLAADAKFFVIGDLNADLDDDGDGVDGTVAELVNHPSLVAWYASGGGSAGSNKGTNGQYNTYSSGCGTDAIVSDPSKTFQLQLDYVLPSKAIGKATGGEIFFPDPATSLDDWNLACAASDHRFVYYDFEWDSTKAQ